MIERLKIYVYILVITKGYGVRARTIGGPNAFAPTLAVLCVSFKRPMVKTRVIILQGVEANCVRCIPFLTNAG